MASVYPAMRGTFGSTDYFIVTMKANDVANQITIPKEMPGWDDMNIEERFQREINYTRVKKQIAPYLANDPDRFFGALIVDVINPEEMDFEPAEKVLGSRVPRLYQTASKSFGFLTLSGGEMLVPLDGQHRLAALTFALSGKDEKQNPISGVDPNPNLANDDVLLIMIKHDLKKGRSIFNKVNRYAKRTSKGDDLITADDDVIAVISRESIANDVIGSRLVNYRSNTLSDKAHYFTTLATVYEATKVTLEENFGRIDVQNLPSREQRTLFEQTAREYWEALTDGVTVFHSALVDKEESGDERRREIRSSSLLGKPVAQLALMRAVVRMRKADKPDGAKFALQEIVDRINEVDWSSDNVRWQRILLNGTRVVSGRQAVLFASRYIAYDLGEPLADEELESLREQYLSHYGPDEVESAALPERTPGKENVEQETQDPESDAGK